MKNLSKSMSLATTVGPHRCCYFVIPKHFLEKFYGKFLSLGPALTICHTKDVKSERIFELRKSGVSTVVSCSGFAFWKENSVKFRCFKHFFIKKIFDLFKSLNTMSKITSKTS